MAFTAFFGVTALIAIGTIALLTFAVFAIIKMNKSS
jgi:hypothetical protein